MTSFFYQLNSRGPLGLFQFGGILVLARFHLAVAFADLLLDFFGDDVDGRVEIAFAGFGEQVGSAHGQADGAVELFFRNPFMVVFQHDACVDGTAVDVFHLLKFFYDLGLDCLGERHIVSRKNQFHPSPRCNRTERKSSFTSESSPYSETRAKFTCKSGKRDYNKAAWCRDYNYRKDSRTRWCWRRSCNSRLPCFKRRPWS